MKRKLLGGLAALLLVACSSGNDATNTTAPPTNTTATTLATTVPATPATAPATAAMTTSAAPTIAPPTTPVTTAPGAPSEAVAEVTTRLNDFWASMDQCFGAPNDCNPDATIAEYTDPTTPIATWFTAWISKFQESGERVIESDQISRELATTEASEGDQSVLTEQCVTDRSTIIKDTATGTTVTDDGTGRLRVTLVWQLTDGKWLVVGSTLTDLDGNGDDVCTFA